MTAIGGACACCGKALCLLWEGVCAYCGRSLCLLWEGSVPAVGRVCACCGRSLCLLWEGFVPDVGRVFACCGRGLFLLWEEPVPAVEGACACCGRSLCSLPNLVHSHWRAVLSLWLLVLRAFGGDQLLQEVSCVFLALTSQTWVSRKQKTGGGVCLTAFSFQFIRLCLLLARAGHFNHTRMICLGKNWLTVLV